MDLQHSKNTAKTVLFENVGLGNPQKNVLSEHAGLEGPEGAEHAENTQKTRVFALRGLSAPSMRRRKSIQKHVLSATGLRKDTQKRVLFRGSSPKTRKNECFRPSLPKAREKQVFPAFRPPWAAKVGPGPRPWTPRGCWAAKTTRFCVFFATPLLEKHAFLRVFEALEVPVDRQQDPGRAPKDTGGSPVSAKSVCFGVVLRRRCSKSTRFCVFSKPPGPAGRPEPAQWQAGGVPREPYAAR